MKTIFAHRDAHISLMGKLTPDKTKIFIDAERLDGTAVTKEELYAILHQHLDTSRVHDGVIDDVARILSNGEKVVERRIIKGIPAEDGQDGKILLLVKKFTGQGEVHHDEKGRTNYFELNLFDNITVDQPVARIYPPKNGVDGKDAMGARIPAKAGKPVKISLDKSIRSQPDGTPEHPFELVVAVGEGYLVEEDGKLAVRDDLTIKGDLDFHHGNIDFIGRVILTGDVLPGFGIRAKKGIEVQGAFQSGGFLVCPHGDIIIRKFASGGEKSRIVCGGSVTLQVARDLDAEVVGNITIGKEAAGCRFRTESSIISPRAQIFGGESYVVCGLEARIIGSDVGTKTLIHLCSDIETKSEFTKLVSAIESHEKALQLLALHLGPLIHNPARMQLLQPTHREKMEKLHKKYREVDGSRISLLTKKKDMLGASRTNEVLRISFHEKIFPGVLITAGNKVYEVMDELKGPASLDFIIEKEEFVLGELKPLECEIQPAPESATPPDKEKKNDKK